MKQTANYQLNQWEKTDRILMSDFNADNQKLDAAIKDASPYRAVVDVTTTAEASVVEVDVSGIDFTGYFKLEVFMDAPGAGSGMGLRFNDETNYIGMVTSGDSTVTFGSTYSVYFDDPSYGMAWLYMPAADAHVASMSLHFVQSSHFGYGHQFVSQTLAWGDVTTLKFCCAEGTFPAGSHFAIYGVRK